MHIEFCAKLNFLEGKYAIMQNIGFLFSWVGNPCRYLVLRPCKKDPDFDGGPPCAARRVSRPRGSAAVPARASNQGKRKIGSSDSGVQARYRHGVPTHDNKNPMFCVLAYSPSKKLSLVQNSICMNLAGLNLWILYR